MRWLKALAVTLVALVIAGVMVRKLAPLPPLEPRTRSQAFSDTGNTLLGEAIAPIAGTQPAYEVRLSDHGELTWIERMNGRDIRHDTEPGTKAWQRAAVAVLSLLPIEWML